MERSAAIRIVVRSWLQAMEAAGRPGMTVIHEHYQKRAGLFTKRAEDATRQVPGWQVAEEVIGRSSHTGDSWGRLYVAVHGRLLWHSGRSAAEFRPEDEFTLRGTTAMFRGYPQVVDRLPAGLAHVARENGVSRSVPIAALPPGPGRGRA